jgi:hypothetical protein
MIKKYRSKPATCEAVLYTGDNRNMIREWAGDRARIRLGTLMIKTNQGNVYPSHDTYIIKGPTDFYPCDKETFRKRWELDEE